MLQYALLHLFGFDLTMDDIKAFRVSLSKQHVASLERSTNVVATSQ